MFVLPVRLVSTPTTGQTRQTLLLLATPRLIGTALRLLLLVTLASPAVAQTVWRIDNTTNIGGHPVTVLGNPLSFPVGIAGEEAGIVYLTKVCSEKVVKIALGGATRVHAGTGTAGH